MRINKINVLKMLFCILIIGFGLSFEKVQAVVTNIPPNSFKDQNELIFKNNVSFSKATSNNSVVKVGKVQTGQFKGQEFAYWDDDKLTNSDYIDLEYKNTGSYKGKEVSVTIRLSDFVTGRNRYDSDKNTTDGHKNYIIFTSNLIHGFTFSGIGSMSATFKAYYNEDSKPVNFEDNSYITFNSLNGSKMVDYQGNKFNAQEFAGYEKMSSLPYYVTTTTGVKEYTNPITKTGSVVGGIVEPSTDGKFTDAVGASDFTNASVTFTLSGQNPKFTIGSSSFMMWIAFNSSAVFNMKPETPQKVVKDESGKDINNEAVVSGQKIQYGISEKVNTLNVDILTRYSSLKMIDRLSNKVTYISSKLVDKDNKEVDSKGNYLYDKESHELVYVASPDFLKTMKMNGEMYTLLITVKVNDDIRANDYIKNTGRVIINTLEQSTNEVENKGSDPKGTFTIYKVTDQLIGFENETLLPKYEEKAQAEVSYQITAEEPVTLTDGTLVAEKNSDFGKITTDGEGIATKKDIYAGKYRAVEVAAPIGIQVDPTPIIIDVVSNKDTATGKGEQKDPLQEVELKIHKSFEKEDGTFEGASGAKFGLFHAINHKIDDKNVILKDTLVSEIEIDEKGLGTYKGILIPEQQYYIKEISTKEGYQLNQEKFYFSYIPVSNDAVHMIELYGNGYIDADVKKDYETERTEKSENKNPEENSGEHSKESTSQSNTEQTEESSTDKSKEDIELINIKNLLIKENNIVKSILKEDGSKVDHYEQLSNGEKVTFEGLVYIGDNEKIESLKVFDELPNGFSFEESNVYDESGNDITNQTTIKNEGQKVTLEIKNEYAKELRRTSIRWVIRTTYKFSMDHKGQVFENQMHLILNDKDIPSNIVTLTPPDIEEKPVGQKPKGILPNTGEMQGYLSVVGVALVLCIVAFWYTRNEQNPEDESNDKTE